MYEECIPYTLNLVLQDSMQNIAHSTFFNVQALVIYLTKNTVII